MPTYPKAFKYIRIPQEHQNPQKDELTDACARKEQETGMMKSNLYETKLGLPQDKHLVSGNEDP